ncbi:tetratricopeptide repeat protein [Chryseobacterium sp. MMS23-Vi53]|uniref:tetratricopeptide repeat protein n=1 Tax=Chryseobacterium sp. MMS23-Vi53 TaxID=3386644 RepID=UPI0039E79784
MSLDNNFFKRLLLVLTLASLKLSSQDYSFFPESIRNTAEYYNKGEYLKAMEYNREALKKYYKDNDKEAIAHVYINIGFLLFSYTDYPKSLDYLEKAQKEIGNRENNPLLMARLYNEYAKNYTRLGMFDKSNATYDKAINYAKRIKDKKQQNYLLFYANIWKRLNFPHKYDSLRIVEKKALKAMPSGIVYARMADKFIDNKSNLDSAKYFLNKALTATDKDVKVIKGMTLFGFGNLSYTEKNYAQALNYYMEALKMYENANSKNHIRAAYDSIAGTYNLMNNIPMTDYYLKKFKSINTDIKNQEKEAINIVVNKIALDEAAEKRTEKNKMYLFILGICLLSLIVIYTIRRINLSKQVEKDRLLEQESLKLIQLQRKTNDNNYFDELTQLAKKNDIFFLNRFREVYPDFYVKLLKHAPNLKDNDIMFCAYIRLNLSNKEIASFKNLTLRSTETTKYRLKKKLNLSEDTNLNNWINTL